ncbi:MAG: hypothetical protein GC193_13655 [Cryomorphaceae bacterium]|nr:hypothetical protein [Cryomorphaceae bacterium]
MEKAAFEAILDDELSCRLMFKTLRETHGITCHKCGPVDHLWIEKKWQWQCKTCGAPKTLRSGTILMHSNLPLSIWFKAIKFMIESKGSISSLEIKRRLNFKRNEPIWYMIHKIRTAMGQSILELQKSQKFDWTCRMFEVVQCDKELKKSDPSTESPVVPFQLNDQHGINAKEILVQAKPGYRWTKELNAKDLKCLRRKYCLKRLNRFRSLRKPTIRGLSAELTPHLKEVFTKVKSKLYKIHRGISLRYLQKYLDEFSYNSIFDSFQEAFEELFGKILKLSWGSAS